MAAVSRRGTQNHVSVMMPKQTIEPDLKFDIPRIHVRKGPPGCRSGELIGSPLLVLKVTELMVEWSLRQKIFRVAEILFRLSAVDSVACEQLAAGGRSPQSFFRTMRRLT